MAKLGVGRTTRKESARRTVRCYLCAHHFEVSLKTMSTACPKCNRAIKIEDVVVKTYLPVIDLQTCGAITITKKGRVAAKNIDCGGDLVIEGVIEGAVVTDGEVRMGPKSSWKGAHLRTPRLNIAAGAKLDGRITVPSVRPDATPQT